MTLSRSFVLAAALSCAAFGADPQFLGRQGCAECHPAQAESQAKSAHARALSRPMNHPLAQEFPTANPLFRAPGFRYQFLRNEDELQVETSLLDQTRRTVVDWAFGAGDQAVTFVSRMDDQWHLEHYWTFYSSTGKYGPTPGHQMTDAGDLGQALGVMYRTFSPQTEVLRCFRCHSTGPLALGEGLSIEPSEAGVQCEGCHGPGSEHAARAAAGTIEGSHPGVINPGRMDPAVLLKACGECHRPPAEQPGEIDYRDPWNVRHQPLYLVRSSCFQKSGVLTCMNCHDAHGPLVRGDAPHYDAACRTCHAVEGACKAGGKAKCASCHMPAVAPQEGLRFTNHWIGVFPTGESYLPRR